MKECHFIVDLQFGSTGKGLLAGYLAEKLQPDTIVTAWGPNAGHTYINARDRKFVNIALPNGIVSTDLRYILLGPGSVINADRLLWEMNEYKDLLKGVKIMIHPAAACVTEEHRQLEVSYGSRIGSTMKGVGEAMCQKIRRRAPHNVAEVYLMKSALESMVCTVDEYNAQLDAAVICLVEGAQGFSLGINTGFYPYTTSRECSVQQLMVDCAIPIGRELNPIVHGVARTYPIRVANRFASCELCLGRDEPMDGYPRPLRKDCRQCKGTGLWQIGTSGPCYDDQEEIAWKDIGKEPELTTVTKLPRRLFTFSPRQIQDACRMSGVEDIFLNFCNYVGAGPDLDQIIEQCEHAGGFPPVKWLGWGPTYHDVEERA